jgi:GntR family histidine utilization transcriptional repressor
VQRAIRELVAEGRLTRVQGSGTFVAPKPKGFSLFEVRDIADEVRQQGGDPQTVVLIQRQCMPKRRCAACLELPEGDLFSSSASAQERRSTRGHRDRYVRRRRIPTSSSTTLRREHLRIPRSHSMLGELETTLSAISPILSPASA